MNIVNAKYKIYNFDPQIKEIHQIHSGDTLTICTTEAPDGQIKTEDDLATSMDIKRANPATGPIRVVEARPGNILRIHIKEIETADIGYMCITPGNQLLGPFIEKAKTKLFKIKDKKVYFNLKQCYPLKPMIGVIGTTPNKIIKTNLAGSHGGNMDNRFITVNSYVYLPVFLDGALFAIGDIHAAMGDGEVCGCGIEIAAKVKIKVVLLRSVPLKFPIIETDKGWIITGEGLSVKKALRVASARIMELLTNYYMMNQEEVLFFLGSYAHFGLCQSAFLKLLPQVVVRIAISNQVLDFSKIRNKFES